MMNFLPSNLLAGVFVVVGIVFVFLSGVMRIRDYQNGNGKKITYSIWKTGFLLIPYGVVSIGIRIFARGLRDTTFIFVVVMITLVLALLFSELVTMLVRIGVQKRAPGADFPPPDKK